MLNTADYIPRSADEEKPDDPKSAFADSDPSQCSTKRSGDSPSQDPQQGTDEAVCDSRYETNEEERPPLPPRPTENHGTADVTYDTGSLKISKSSARPQLLSKATTAVSRTDIHTQPAVDSKDVTPRPTSKHIAASIRRGFSAAQIRSSSSSADLDDNGSIRSVQTSSPFQDTSEDVQSLLGGFVGGESSTRTGAATQMRLDPWTFTTADDHDLDAQFEREFDPLRSSGEDDFDEETQVLRYRAKLKHYFILSSAGKPIYSRHGDDQVTSNSISIIQTIISFYQEGNNPIKGFSSGGAQFCILSKGHLHMAAISRLRESQTQLAAQLEALYMQILSALTLPIMERKFLKKPSTNLRQPLEGTEPLLSALADGFTRGSPSTLLAALECLRLRKRDREMISKTMVRCRSEHLVYGLIVAGGRLVSVLRPKKHSLHPGDLHLIFNMLFEAEGVRTAGGENWIPLCLPGFNNQRYVHMYVSFLNKRERKDEGANPLLDQTPTDEQIAIILISGDRESFFEMKKVRDNLVEQLHSNGGLQAMRDATQQGRPKCTELVPGTALRHFLYKSRSNVQFLMPAAEEQFQSPVGWRKLMTHYSSLHATVHDRTSHLRVYHCTSETVSSMVWISPIFELYCIAPSATARSALAQAANKIVRWAAREEERIFIIGGAVF